MTQKTAVAEASTVDNPSPLHERVVQVPLDRIVPDPARPERPTDARAVTNLAKSIKKDGLLHPPTIRRLQHREDTPFGLISGWHRYLATQRLGWKTISAVLREDVTNGDVARIAWAEDIRRGTMTQLHQSIRLRATAAKGDFTEAQLADISGLPRSVVSERLAVGDLPRDLLEPFIQARSRHGQHYIQLLILARAFRNREDRVAELYGLAAKLRTCRMTRSEARKYADFLASNAYAVLPSTVRKAILHEPYVDWGITKIAFAEAVENTLHPDVPVPKGIDWEARITGALNAAREYRLRVQDDRSAKLKEDEITRLVWLRGRKPYGHDRRRAPVRDIRSVEALVERLEAIVPVLVKRIITETHPAPTDQSVLAEALRRCQALSAKALYALAAGEIE